MYTKLFQTIVTSSLWSEDSKICKVWVTLLAMTDRNGEVLATIPGLARICALSIPEVEAAIQKFESEDAYSRTPDDGGRRIQAIEGGWLILNYAKYRDMASREDLKRQNAERQRRFRERQSRNGIVTESNEKEAENNGRVTDTLHIAEAEAEAEFLIEPQKAKVPACLDSYVVPSEGGQAGDPEFSEKVEEAGSSAPTTLERWLSGAATIKADEGFARSLWTEMEDKGWIASDGSRVASWPRFLADAWKREQARPPAPPSPSDQPKKRERWMVEADIASAKSQAEKICRDKSSYNLGGSGPSLDQHRRKYEAQWLAFVRASHEEARRVLPSEFAAFERDHAAHVEEMVKSGVSRELMGEDYRLTRFAEFLPDDVPSFERWDRECNAANRWLDPKELTPDARTMVKAIKAHVASLESELRGMMNTERGEG